MKNIQSIIQAIKPNRKIEGISAILLPFTAQSEIDMDGFETLLGRTLAAGLIPAVNMDTGYGHLLTEKQRLLILERTASISSGKKFVAGVFVTGQSPDLLGLIDEYQRAANQVVTFGGTPILFQSAAMKKLDGEKLLQLYLQTALSCGSLLAFELGEMFADFGRIYSLPVVEELMRIPEIQGLKHSSLRRELEWERLRLRDQIRPDFKIYTGNDLAIDMVMYGSDYLLGLSSFAPDYFSKRDAYWLAGDLRFYELNDTLQYLGNFAFRPPVSLYKHTAAQFLYLRQWINSDFPHPQTQQRSAADRAVLEKIREKLESL